ncbi:hypothetical protein EAO69_00745 [Streptomyces sp. me109]|nr:hypothetical protein EAO69_00745 [Streptomyces sp. me109]
MRLAESSPSEGACDPFRRRAQRDGTTAGHHHVSLGAGHDRHTDRLRAGQALERVLLVTTAHGLRTSLLRQALVWADLRGKLCSATAPFDQDQRLFRLGYGPEDPPPRAAPRTSPSASTTVPPRRIAPDPGGERATEPRPAFGACRTQRFHSDGVTPRPPPLSLTGPVG